MTREKAVEKILKLRRLAKNAGTSAEAANAARAADELAAKHGLTKQDLQVENEVLAFDELLRHLGDWVSKKQAQGSEVPDAVHEAINGVRDKGSREEKSKALRTVVNGLRIVCTIGFFSKPMRELKKIVEETLSTHEVVI